MKQIPVIINQLFELKQKLIQAGQLPLAERNLNRIFNTLEEEGYVCKDPAGEAYSETRTDCHANIVGRGTGKLFIIQVIKPMIYKKENNALTLLQKAVVMVESK